MLENSAVTRGKENRSGDLPSETDSRALPRGGDGGRPGPDCFVFLCRCANLIRKILHRMSLHQRKKQKWNCKLANDNNMMMMMMMTLRLMGRKWGD